MKFKVGDWVKVSPEYYGFLHPIVKVIDINESQIWIETKTGAKCFFMENYVGFELYNPTKLERALL